MNLSIIALFNNLSIFGLSLQIYQRISIRQQRITLILLFQFHNHNIFQKNMSGNKNMAHYSQFDGNTNKKIVQAPGGASSFSLAWSNQPTDYGPERNYRRLSRQKNQDYQPKPQQRVDYSEPIRVMDEPPKSYGSRNMGSMNQHNHIGGEHGYNNYNNSPPVNQNMMGGYGQSDQRQSYGNYGNYRNPPIEQLEIAVQEQQKIPKNQRPPSVPRQQNSLQGKSSIKLNGPPRDNQIFGNQEYNYWKDTSSEKKQTGSSQKRINQQYSDYQKNGGTGEKTSVRVHNPPGGKTSFTLG